MKTAHWVTTNGSGMHHLAEACADAERRLGHEASLIDLSKPQTWESGPAVDADIHVNHTQFPEGQRQRIRQVTGKAPKVVFVSHGIPEHTFELAVQEHLATDKYDTQDYWMLFRHLLRTSDALVVFTPRYQALFQTMAHRSQIIDLVPMGVDRAFWAGGVAADRPRGLPAVWMSENQHRIKWALDVFLAWPFVLQANPLAHLHAPSIPFDQHRFMVDLANSNGAAYGATISAKRYSHKQLRGFWKACDFNLATTRYGDNTLITMQAEAAGLRTISYNGNEHASFWIPEGDQRTMATELLKIFSGETPERAKTPVPDLLEMGRGMLAVYERVLGA